MELRHLEVFRVLAEERHFGRAAQRLYLGQSSVSQQLQRLEADVGAQLVHRTSRRVELTAAGEVFLEEVEQVLGRLEQAVQLARQAASGRRGTVRIGTNYPAGRLLLLPLLERLRDRLPDLSTLLREMGTDDQLRALERGDLDLGLGYGPVDSSRVDSVHLRDVPVVGTVRHGHPLADRDLVGYPELGRHRYLTGVRGSGSHIDQVVLRTAAAAGVRLVPSDASTDLASYLLELEITDAIGFCSVPRGEQNRASGMAVLRLGPPEPTLQLHALVARPAPPPVRLVLDQLVALAGHPGGVDAA
ncbi:LysR family transcriptional regulator [Desertihabitans brevis]|uniref:LysR family transcriptional regulator n=1 Tax=Desertihabitans brevis TaxID=2268447 RepID=A0A367YWR9_9ACTN|nr:LysR family transcriptional regulator [Desertihabitans brevis]RCK70343.1 LysR family transcriptional regulator [Desertihabitans brevis]